MISNIYPDMSFAYQTPLYQHGASISSGAKHHSNIMVNSSYNHNHPSSLPVMTNYQQPHISSVPNNHSLLSNSNMNTQQQYHHQPWKLGHTSNELMLSHEIMIRSSAPYFQRNAYNNESSLSVDSYRHHQLNNNMYNVGNDNRYFSSSPTLSPTTSTLVYNNQQGMLFIHKYDTILKSKMYR